MLDIRQHATSLTIRGIDETTQQKIIRALQKEFKFDYDVPTYPTWKEWSPKIPLTASAKEVHNQELYTRSGCYKVWHKNTLIYIGETRCQRGTGGGRPGMWARRGDFRSTVLGENIQNPYGNATRFLEEFGKDISNVSHTFHYVHPIYCKQAEEELFQEYYKKHKTLPILQHEKDYKRVR